MKILLITSESNSVSHFSTILTNHDFYKKNLMLTSEKNLSVLIQLNPTIVFIEQTKKIMEELKLDIQNIDETNKLLVFYKEGEPSMKRKGNIYFLTLPKGDITKIITSVNVLRKLEQIDKIKENIETQVNKLKSRKEKVSSLSNEKKEDAVELDSIIKYQPTIRYTNKIIAIGASIGGLNVMDTILTELEKELKPHETVPPILYTQHITKNFAKNIIDRVQRKTNLNVKEAKNQLSILNNSIYMPFDQHFVPKLKNGRLQIELLGDSPISSHSPSIDVMFRGISNICSKTKTLSIILTGMGRDGVEGMNNLKKSGSKTIAQEPSTTVVPGIINECINQGSIDEILVPMDIVEQILKFIRS